MTIETPAANRDDGGSSLDTGLDFIGQEIRIIVRTQLSAQ